MSLKEQQFKPHTDIKYFKNNKKYEESVIKDCVIENDFIFKRINFVLCSKQKYFMVCVPKNGELYSIWNYPEQSNGSEVMSLFRKGMMTNNINEENINTFLDSPKKYMKNKKALKK